MTNYRRTRYNKRYFRTRQKVKLRYKKTAAKFATSIFICLIVCLIIFFAYRKINNLIVNSDKLKIKNIEITGLETISNQKFIDSLPNKYIDNFVVSYFLDFEKYLKNKFLQIKSVKIERIFKTNTLKFYITERIPIAYIVKKNKIYAVDDTNSLFILNISTDSLPEIVIGQQDSNEILKNVIKFINYFVSKQSVILNKLKKIYIAPNEHITFILSDNISNNIKVLWGKFSIHNFDMKINYLNKVVNDVYSKISAEEDKNKNYIKNKKRIVKNKLEYVDLRLSDENRVFVKLIKE